MLSRFSEIFQVHRKTCRATTALSTTMRPSGKPRPGTQIAVSLAELKLKAVLCSFAGLMILCCPKSTASEEAKILSSYKDWRRRIRILLGTSHKEEQSQTFSCH